MMATAYGLTLSHPPSSPGPCRPRLLGVLILVGHCLDHDVWFSPLLCTCFAPRLAFGTVGKLLPSFTVGVIMWDSQSK